MMSSRVARLNIPQGRFPMLASIRRVNPALIMLLVLLVGIAILSPLYRTPAGMMSLLQRAAPLVILTCGQAFVLISGGFDLAQGSLVTLVVIACAIITGGDAALTAEAIGIAVALGFFVGAVNGFVVSYLKVPSIIATLGALLSVKGAAMMWSGGAPQGYLPDNLRMFGRLVIRPVPIVGGLPVAVIVLIVVLAVLAFLLHATQYGKLLTMVGDNPRAAELAGAPVRPIRFAAFVISSLSAVIAGILLGGFSGVSVDVGTGLELQGTSAAVIGGIVLLGGRGSIFGAAVGALSLYALFTLLNLIGFPEPMRVAVQGIILIVAAAITSRRQMAN
ncbi:ABC transporter permease [Rhizobium sp. P38BS-XIX]|uniref:ABC transporter permease n=1 Tax=Rhizobium sp. P38BS-XIX TaxID=2726740 RepID=UPI001FEEEF47|nr:ABC transporter permease [Rhizobium sp. P38BS-XIX]